MREIGRVIRIYASDQHNAWDRIIIRLEGVVNVTVHSSTGYIPEVLHKDGKTELNISQALKSNQEYRQSKAGKIRTARENLQKVAKKKRK